MELTKWEQKVTSPKHEKENKLMLWIGIFFIVLSIASIPYIMHVRNKVSRVWEENYTKAETNIEANTDSEIELKNIILNDAVVIHDLSVDLITEKSARLPLMCFTLGTIFIGVSVRSRIYIKTIKKLNDS